MGGWPGSLNGAGRAIYWGRERTWVRDCQGVEAPGPVLFSREKVHPRGIQPNTRT